MNTGTSYEPLCKQCGRPVVGVAVWGTTGPYHEECVIPPNYSSGVEFHTSLTELMLRLESLEKEVEELKRKIVH